MRVFSLAFWVALATGCGAAGAENTARHVMDMTAVVVDGVDTDNANAMSINREADREATSTRGGFIRRRSVYWRVQESVDGLRLLLFSAEAFVDAGAGEGFADIAACLVRGVVRLAEAVVLLEVVTGEEFHLPDEVDTVLALLGVWGGQCEVPDVS